MANWHDEAVRLYLEGGRSYAQIAGMCGVTKAAVDSLIRRMRAAGTLPDASTSSDTEDPCGASPRKVETEPELPPVAGHQHESLNRQLQARTDELAHARRLLRARRREDNLNEYIREVAFNLAGERLSPPKWTSPKATKSRSAGVPTLFLSDLHWGEVVDPREVWGLNEYSMEIARRRLRTVTENAIHLLRDHIKSPAGYPGIVCALGGDMVSGGIHPELQFTDEATAMESAVDCSEALAATIALLADEFGQVWLPCVTGNHGRQTEKTWHKKRVGTSWDWLIYHMLEKRFDRDSRVQFLVSQDTDVLYTVSGLRYLLTHGDQMGVKGGDGIIGALGPIMRGVKKMQATNAGIGRAFDVCMMGHWHQSIYHHGVIVNGTTKGLDEYARSMRFGYEEPCQNLWLTHPAHGVTLPMRVFAEEPRPRGSVPAVAMG